MLPLRAVAVAFLFLPPVVRAASAPIQIDGEYSDWAAPVQATDPSGDDGSSGIDFTRLQIAHDEFRVFLRFDTGVEVQPDEFHDITVALDTDLNAGTGDPVASIGADLVWNLGQRSGTFYAGGNSYSVDQNDIGFFIGPTVSDVEFEMAFDRAAVPAGGAALFPGTQFRAVVLEDAGGGDLLDASALVYTLDAVAQTPPSLAFGRSAPGDVRLASYNVENDGLFDGGADAAALDRIFDAVDPDVWVINEVWNHDATETRDQVETFLPSGPGESWSAEKLDSGNVVVSRFPILGSWDVSPGDRLTAVLLDARPQLDSDLLVVANHWSCCASDNQRQDQADALIGFLADARTSGGTLDLAPGTPILAAGDFNLVGWRAQLETAVTGDIADNSTFGPDSPPDWDGSDFDAVPARHPDARLTATWWSETSTFSPGRLDWIFYTGSSLELANHFIVETRSMTAANLAQHGLLAGDTVQASDHAAIVADFRAPSASTGVAPETGRVPLFRLDAVEPNPLRTGTSVRFSLDTPVRIRVTVHDVAGRVVRNLARGAYPPGTHRVVWDGREASGRSVAAGAYFVRLATEGTERGAEAVSTRVVVIR